ncbi:uncharacterized protein LOC131059993 isoform X2 [Cryptomeria japonica]|nr:uncharacterized protein LOC131059993 isoform X2 [Cryptomeria japonica]
MPYMGHIAHLPEAVFNTLRSTTNLSDFAQIVEELISNSIDAGSIKVQVFIDVGSSYIKVEDDGCGIRRDDLTLLGERHATSKLHTLAELNLGVKTLGFRGEALSSLSDVALLEVTTRARGSPNAYTKIVKGCKCLSLGLSHGTRGLGTTVIARDVFYSQPVRRRLLQSSPKKVLQSVRERVLRIALIHPHVAFKVIDVDKEEEVIHTNSATSSICILSSIFGTELANNLRELDFAKGNLRLSGFLSKSPNHLSSKAVQFFYINSHFVQKTPIHKLLNKQSTKIKSILVPSDDDLDQIDRGNEKPVKDSCEMHLYPAYVLNLSCSLLSYDITYEVSKTMVEFKDWAHVISFINEVLQQTWGQFPANSPHRASRFDLSRSDAKSTTKKRKKMQHINPTHQFSGKTEARKSMDDCHLPDREACCKRKQREVSAELVSEISQMPVHLRIEQNTNKATLSSISCRDNVSEITFNSTQWCAPKIHGSKEENIPPLQRKIFGIKSKKDEENNGFLEMEWENQVPGSGMEIPDRRQMKFKTMSDLYYIYDDEAQSTFYTLKSKDVLSKRESAEEMMKDVLTPVFSNEKLLGKEVRFGPDDGEQSNSYVRMLDSSCDEEHSLSSQMSCSFLSPITNGWTPVTRKLGRHMWGDDDHSIYKEIDWPRDEELLEIDYLIAKDNIQSVRAPSTISPESCTYSQVDSLYANRGNRLARNRSLQMDLETVSLKDKCGQKTSGVQAISFCVNSDKLIKDSSLYFKNGLDSHRSKFGRITKELWGVNERKKGSQEFQPYAFSSKDRDLNDVDFQTYDFGLDHPSSSKLRKMVPTVSSYSESKDYNQHTLGSRYDMELITKRFYHASSKAIKRRSMSAPPLYKSRRKYGLHINPPCSLSTITTESKYCSDRSKLSGGDIPISDFQVELESTFRDVQEPNQLETDVQEEEETVEAFEQSEPLLLLDKPNSLTENKNAECKLATNGVLSCPIALSAIENPGDLLMVNTLEDWKQKYLRNDCEDDVLNICSGALNLANSDLVPKSITKDCFMKANILQQLDRKYIVIVAQGNLAVVDQIYYCCDSSKPSRTKLEIVVVAAWSLIQCKSWKHVIETSSPVLLIRHAADERIRLEQLRKEVLEAEERKRITFLEYEEELVLPVGGVQLLQSYSDRIEKWGWRYKIVSHKEGPFRRKAHQLHRSSCKAILTAVPCILGVDLTAEDLSEYIQQLVQTDGSSAAPSAVIRILNFKACRGAIMFGDMLLQSECALLVEELKRTSLCFQCAHGRPTIVPLVNLEALHRQLTKFDKASHSGRGLLGNSSTTSGNASLYSTKCWHRLQKHRATLERAKMRLN